MAGRALALFLACAVVAATSGCARYKRAKECDAFIRQVNAALRDVDQAAKSEKAPAKPSEMRELGDRYAKLSQDVAQMEISTPELKKLSEDYQKMADRAAKAARSIAEAIEKRDLEQAKAQNDEFDAVSKQETALVARINGLCKGEEQ
jgi:hypothetical protein